jgi:hypothetical protein
MTRTRSYPAIFAAMAATAMIFVLPSVAGAAPANDNFADAQTITGQSASAGGTNVGATLEGGDPRSVAGYLPTSHTVWYRWTAPFSGPVRVDTCTAADYDTILGVYTGSALGSLRERTGDDDACGLAARSEVRFNATENTTYQILVDGYNGREGTFTLEVNQAHSIDCRGGETLCTGTDTSDRITGTRAKDNIQAGGGEDEIFAQGANDIAIGGGDDDVVNGNKGRDKLYGGEGNDVVYTGGLDGDRDSVDCGAGQDTVYRERKTDTVANDCEDVINYGSGGGGGGY